MPQPAQGCLLVDPGFFKCVGKGPLDGSRGNIAGSSAAREQIWRRIGPEVEILGQYASGGLCENGVAEELAVDVVTWITLLSRST